MKWSVVHNMISGLKQNDFHKELFVIIYMKIPSKLGMREDKWTSELDVFIIILDGLRYAILI